MNRTITRVLLVLFALVLLSTTGLAQDSANNMDLADAAADSSSREFVMMGLDMESGRDWNTHAFFAHMKDLTGINFTFKQYSNEAQYNAAKDTAFASNDLPDVLFKAALTPIEELRYSASGQLINLTPLLPESAPTLSKILDARPDFREAITHPDGVIAALPSLNAYERQCYIWINQAWLTNLGLTKPVTFDELANVLAAFQNDPNQNNRNDEIPLSFVGPWEAKFLLHAFGIIANDYNIYVDDLGKVNYAPFDDNYRKFVESMRYLMERGLIDPSAFRQGQSQRNTVLSDLKVNTMGAFISIAPYTLLSQDLSAEYSILPPLLADGSSTASYRKLLSGIVRGTFAVTSACSDPSAMLGWIDYLYTDEGGRLAIAGVQDVDFKWLPDNTWQWMVDDYTTIDMLLRDRVIRTDNMTPGLEPADFVRRTDIALESRVRREGDSIIPQLITPYPFTWPTNEAREDEIATLSATLGLIVDESISKFIDGEISITDENWTAFMEELRVNGADRLVQLFQEKLDEQSRLEGSP